MFALRDLGGEEAVDALVLGLSDSSALFRHEVRGQVFPRVAGVCIWPVWSGFRCHAHYVVQVAFVLGQMEDLCAKDALLKVLMDTSEAAMVRHEAAEALGAIGGSDVQAQLATFVGDSVPAVAESCVVALDAADYWSAFARGEKPTL